MQFLCESDLRISCIKEKMEKLMEKNTFLPHFYQKKGINVNLTLSSLPEGSLEITHTVPSSFCSITVSMFLMLLRILTVKLSLFTPTIMALAVTSLHDAVVTTFPKQIPY